MPTGIYPRSEIHNERNSEAQKKNLPKFAFKKGYIPSKESVDKMRATKKNIPWSEVRRKAQLNVRYSFQPHWSEERKKRYQELHPVKKPLIKNSKEYHPLWAKIRKQIYNRDGWLCQECGVHCSKKQQIQCHHIDYDITNNVFSNLITLCSSCHMKTGFKREDWIKHYKNLIGARGLIISEN
jgi:5-methylcytosine-specific restriction endonuclease McrA